MSGTTGLGGLLATRLDAVMGTTLAKHPVVLDGKPGHNTAQPAQNINGQDSTIRRAAEQVGARTGQTDARQVGVRGGAAEAAQAAKAEGQTTLTSARTLLSEPAQTILALLLGSLKGQATLQGRFPLLPLPPAPATPGQTAGSGAQAGGASAGATGGSAAGSAAGTASGAATAGAGNAAAAGNTAAGTGASAATGANAPASANAGARPAAGLPLPGAVATTALPPAPPGMAPAMAAALQQTVNQSGLFYESHLAQMAFGKRDAAEVLREPQARLPQPSQSSGPGNANAAGANPGTAAGAGTGAAAGSAGAPAGAPAAFTASTAAQAGAAAGFGAGGAASAAAQASSGVNLSLAAQAGQAGSTALAGIHPDAIPLVRQQLEALANQAFNWQGQAWEGADMNWQIQRREPEEGQADAVASWATRLNLELPRLGNVEARLSLADNRLVLRLVAPSSAPLLQEHLNVLRERLLSQGLQLTDTAISSQTLGPNTPNTATNAAGTGATP